MHIVFKSEIQLVENHGLKVSKMYKMVKILTSYGAGTKFIKNSGLYRTSDVKFLCQTQSENLA